MSNSSLVVYTKLSPNCNKPRNKPITHIVVHHMAANGSIEALGNLFAQRSRQASSNYGIGSDGRIGMYVEECNRSWCSSSGEIDHKAITIEVANDGGAPNWHVSDKAFESLVALCTDICKRNGIPELKYTGDKSGNLHMHKWYAATGCPGEYLGSKFPELAKRVNANLGTTKPTTKPTTKYEVAPSSKFLGSKGYLTLGDRGDNVKKLCDFMYRCFPSYATVLKRDKKNLLGNLYGENLKAWVMEFQKRTKDEAKKIYGITNKDYVDGNVGKVTLAMLKRYGFKE